MHLSHTALLFILVFISSILGIGYFNYGWESGYAYGLLPQVIVFVAAGSVVLFILFLVFNLKENQKAQWVIAVTFFILNVITPTLLSISHRRQTAPHLFVHDNPIQMEEAIKLLLNGQNPYGFDYSGTPMGKWPYGAPIYSFIDPAQPEIIKTNPALMHVVSLPFGFLSILPFAFISDLLLGWFDARFVYLSAFIITVIFGTKLIAKDKRLDFFILFALNPLITGFLIVGHNDILVTSLLVITLYLAHKNYHLASAIPLGLALAAKQVALPFFFLYLAYIYFKNKNLQTLLKISSLSIIIAAILILPFFIWNPAAFWRDTVGFISGSEATSYPIKGIGISMVLLASGLIPNALSAFPANIFQVVVGIPALIAAVFYLKKSPSLASLCISFPLVYIVLLFFSRFFVDSYLGLAAEFLILGYFLQAKNSVIAA